MSKKAFSLVELSVVLIIIGLLAGSVSVASRLIEGARLQSVMKELNRIKTASNVFQTTYGALPGDLSNAMDYFSASDCDNIDGGTASNDKCNGDGNALIDLSNSETSCTERHNFWLHLAYAEILTAKVRDCSAYFKSTEFDNLAISAQNITVAASNNADLGLYTNFFVLGQTVAASLSGDADATYDNVGSIFTPAQAKKLDDKLDDGVAYTGLLQGFNGEDQAGSQGSGCSSNAVNASNSTDYVTTNKTRECYLVYPINLVF